MSLVVLDYIALKVGYRPIRIRAFGESRSNTAALFTWSSCRRRRIPDLCSILVKKSQSDSGCMYQVNV